MTTQNPSHNLTLQLPTRELNLFRSSTSQRYAAPQDKEEGEHHAIHRRTTLSSFRISPYSHFSPIENLSRVDEPPPVAGVSDVPTKKEETPVKKTGSHPALLSRKSTLSSFGSSSPRDTIALTPTTGKHPFAQAEPVTMTPIPMGGLVAVCFIFMCEGFNYCFLFPFVGFMVMDFGMASREEDAGYYAGQLAGCFALAQLFSGFLFGYLADKFSKRKVFLISCTGTTITMLMFGFSRNFAFAVVCRTICGLFNGNVSTGKAYLADITDSTNQAYAYSFYGLTWGVGAIMGPAVGGLLSRPAKTYAVFDTPFFNTYPYVLPCLFCALTQVIAMIICSIYMVPKKDKTSYDNNVDDIESTATEKEALNKKNISDTILNDIEHTVVEEIIYDDEEDQIVIEPIQVQPFSHRLWGAICNIASEIVEAVNDRDVLITSSMYFFTSCCDTMQEELFPLWSIIPSEKGGLSFSNQTIGIYNTMQGIILLIQPTCFQYVTNHLGKLDTYRLGFLLVIPLMFTPLLNMIQIYGGGYALWGFLIVYCFNRMFTTMLTFTAVFILINNAAPHGKVGTVMGFSNSAGCCARAVATFSAGPILSICATSLSAMHIPFIIACGVMSTAALGLSSLLTPSINELKCEQK